MKRAQDCDASFEEIKTAKTRKLNENDMFQLIAQLVSLSKVCNTDLDVLHLIVLGDQATGKSTLLNRLIGHDLLPSRCSTDSKNNLEAKTLCPITLHTINREGIFRVTIKSPSLAQTVEFETLESAQKNIIDTLDQIQLQCSGGVAFNNNFSIEVTVEGPDVKNMHFVDLPGNRNDTKHISNKINSIIEEQVTKNKNAIILFLMNGSTDPSVTSTWNIINKLPNKNDIILILTRPDGRGNDDESLIHFLDSCETRSKIPRSNIFIVKNKDSTNKEELKAEDYDSREMMWFLNHNIYSKYTDDPNYSTHFGKANLNKFIVDKLKTKIVEQIPKLQISIKKILKDTEDERNRLGSKLSISSNVDRAYEYFNATKLFSQKLDDALKGKNNPQLATKFKQTVLRFKTDISLIRFNGDISQEEILKMVTNSGGIEIRILGSDDEIVHNVLFHQKNSPYQQLLIKLEEYIDALHSMLSQMLNSIDCSKDSKIDSTFWQALKDVLLNHLDKENLKVCFIAFCRTQKHNYDSYLMMGESKVEEHNPYKNVPNKTFKYDPINTIQKFWQSIIDNIGQNFPKYVREFLIEENISKFDDILKENMETLYLLIKEPDDIEQKRTKLDQGIILCKNIMQLSMNFVHL